MLRDLNSVRISKRMLLLFELVGIDSRSMTNAYVNDKEVSSIEWKYLIHYDVILTPKQYCMWNNYKQWLKKQEVATEINFREHMSWRWLTNRDCSQILIKDDNEYRFKATEIKQQY